MTQRSQIELLDEVADQRDIDGFVLLDTIGKGNGTIVYLARQRFLNRLVAFKTIFSAENSVANLMRLRHEADLAARLQHPGIVQLHEIIETSANVYCVFEYVDGGNLRDRLRIGPMSPDLSAKLIESTARAVHFAHSRGITHCDLKPENILLTQDLAPKVTDFGIARVGAEIASNAKIEGTPRYMAPEQIDNQTGPMNPSVDIHALGVVLYEMLTGRPPYAAGTVVDTLQQICFQPPLDPRRLQPKLPASLTTICLKCLSKSAASRYYSALDLADDLRRFSNSQPIHARHASWIERAVLWRRRNRVVASLIAFGCFTLLVVLVMFAFQYDSTLDSLHRVEKAERQRAIELIQTLCAADAAAASTVLASIAESRQIFQPLIEQALLRNDNSELQRTRLHLAAVDESPQFISELFHSIWTTSPDEFALILTTLKISASNWPTHWEQAIEQIEATSIAPSTSDQRRFRALVALTLIEPDRQLTSAHYSLIATQLIHTNVLELPAWTRMLKPHQTQLIEPIAKFMEDEGSTAELRRRAASLLSEYAAEDGIRLADAISTARPEDFDQLFQPLERFREHLVPSLIERLQQRRTPDVWDLRNAYWKRLANTAILLLRLDESDAVWPVFRHSPDPTLRSYVICTLGDLMIGG